MLLIQEKEVTPKPGVKGLVKARFISFRMILSVGFLLLVSLVFSAALDILGNYLGGLVPGIQFFCQLSTSSFLLVQSLCYLL